MRTIRSIAGLSCLFIFLFSLDANFSSCKKQVITDTLILKDTVHIRDTVHVVDSATCSCYDLSDGLVGYYNFNGGNLNDSSGYGNNIVFNNATKTNDRFGRANNAYVFDGSSSYMKILNSASLNPNGAITLMAIVKVNDFYKGDCHGNQIIHKGGEDQNQGVYSLRITDNAKSCYTPADTSKELSLGFYGDYAKSSGAVDTANFVKKGVWMNIVFTYDGTQSKIYINGQLKNTVNQTAVFTPNSYDLYIGHALSNLYPFWFNGVIDEVRVYKKALCEGAVKQLSASTN